MAPLLLLLAASLVCAQGRPTDQKWRVESSIVRNNEDSVTLLRFDYDGANVSEGDEQQVLAHLATSMHQLGLPQISLAVTLESSAIRVALRDPVAAAKIVHAVQHGHLQPPPNPTRTRPSFFTWQTGLGATLLFVCIVAVMTLAVLRARNASQEHAHRAQLKRGSTCPTSPSESLLLKRGSLLA